MASGDLALEVKGYVTPIHQIQVSPKVSGQLVQLDPKFQEGAFFKAFKDKWHFENLLANIPVSVVLNESAPLLGAAYEALGTVRR